VCVYVCVCVNMTLQHIDATCTLGLQILFSLQRPIHALFHQL